MNIKQQKFKQNSTYHQRILQSIHTTFRIQYDHFNSQTQSIIQENQHISRKINHTNKIINEQNETIKMLIERSQSSFDRFILIFKQLFQQLSSHKELQSYLIQVHNQVKAQITEWNKFQSKIIMRKLSIHPKKSNTQKLNHINLPIQNFNLYEPTLIKRQEPQQFKSYIQSSKFKKKPSIKMNNGYEFDDKMRLRQQFFTIKQFVFNDLSSTIEYSQQSEIPKKIILNIYLKWNKQKERTIQIEQTAKIQMQLTNQLKSCFPKMNAHRKSYRGIKFKSQHLDQLQLTDRSLITFQQDLQFNPQDYLNPINNILKQVEEKDLHFYYQQEEEEFQINKDQKK